VSDWHRLTIHGRLGSTQKTLLDSLEQHGLWKPGCGWVYDNESGTRRRLDALVNKHLVVARRYVDFDGTVGDVLWYAPATPLDQKTARMVCWLVRALLTVGGVS
jgi:hypothetical protein